MSVHTHPNIYQARLKHLFDLRERERKIQINDSFFPPSIKICLVDEIQMCQRSFACDLRSAEALLALRRDDVALAR